MAGFEELTMRLAGRPEYKENSSSSRFEFEAARRQQQMSQMFRIIRTHVFRIGGQPRIMRFGQGVD